VTCSFFETTIRYLGGMLSTYDLTGQQHQFLIDQARELGNRLSLAWTQVHRVVYVDVLNSVPMHLTGKRYTIQRHFFPE
jgi:mannosyl-oligosaccharide alpha-1,2-mannosidase